MKEISEEIKKGADTFDEIDLKNLIYREVIQIVEPLEHNGKYKGNSHHLAQEIVEKVTSAIVEKVPSLKGRKGENKKS